MPTKCPLLLQLPTVEITSTEVEPKRKLISTILVNSLIYKGISDVF
jgi:hypothetical protein